MTSTSTKMPRVSLADAVAVSLIGRIADRAVGLYAQYGLDVDRRDVQLDLTACHFSACRLRLDEMLSAPDVDLAHDLGGINRHLDREALKLGDCFVPRFAARRI
jgi:hypothetical protein